MDLSNPLHQAVLVSYITGGVGVIALIVSLIFLMAGFIGWKSPRRKRRFIISAIGLGTCVSLVVVNHVWIHAVVLPSMGRAALEKIEARYAQTSVVQPGDPAPPFVITDIEGREISLTRLKGRVIAVNFFATWCGPCLKGLPYLQKIHDDYDQDARFALMVIGREESEDTLRAFQQKHDYTFPLAADPNRDIYGLYAKERVPRTYLIASDGKIASVFTGFEGAAAADRLRAGIEAELKKAPRLVRPLSDDIKPPGTQETPGVP